MSRKPRHRKRQLRAAKMASHDGNSVGEANLTESTPQSVKAKMAVNLDFNIQFKTLPQSPTSTAEEDKAVLIARIRFLEDQLSQMSTTPPAQMQGAQVSDMDYQDENLITAEKVEDEDHELQLDTLSSNLASPNLMADQASPTDATGESSSVNTEMAQSMFRTYFLSHPPSSPLNIPHLLLSIELYATILKLNSYNNPPSVDSCNEQTMTPLESQQARICSYFHIQLSKHSNWTAKSIMNEARRVDTSETRITWLILKFLKSKNRQSAATTPTATSSPHTVASPGVGSGIRNKYRQLRLSKPSKVAAERARLRLEVSSSSEIQRRLAMFKKEEALAAKKEKRILKQNAKFAARFQMRNAGLDVADIFGSLAIGKVKGGAGVGGGCAGIAGRMREKKNAVRAQGRKERNCQRRDRKADGGFVGATSSGCVGASDTMFDAAADDEDQIM